MKLLLIEAADRPASTGGELRDLGYTVDLVADGRQAVERATQGDYEVVILDLLLPRDQSLPILHEIRETSCDVKILVLSDREQIHDRVTALIQGADDFLVKPVGAAELHARIRQLSSEASGPRALGMRRAPRGGEPDFRIGELLRGCELGDIELVISEVPLAALLRRISGGLEGTALARGVNLLLPQSPLPTLLVDAGWMQQLLASLLFDALVHARRGSCVELRVDSDRESCRIDIETGRGNGCDLSLARRFARHLNLQVDCAGPAAESVRVSIGGIKIR